MFALLFLPLVAAAPPLYVDSPTIELGELKAGPSVERRFSFVNAGAEPLTITGLRASCHCAAPRLDRRTFQPGERGELTLEVNTLAAAAGPQRWTLAVDYTCGGQAGSVTLAITAKLVREVRVEPAELVLRGVPKEPPSICVHFDGAARHAHVTEVLTSSPRVRLKGIAAARYVVEVADNLPSGTHAEWVRFRTDHPDYPELKVPVTITVAPKQSLTAAPARAALVAGSSALVQLRAANGRSVKVERAEASHPALTCRWAAGPGDFATLKIGLDRAKWDGGDLTAEVRVTANGETIAVPVAVRARD